MVSAKSDPKLEAKSETQASKLPTFDSLKEDAMIQSKVKQRLQELSELAKTGTIQKLKSQRGGQVEVMDKNRVKWPHEYILSSLNKERVSYDQLSVTQWVAGFGRTIRKESDPEIKQHMLDYMISLMDDANDFSWVSAKASHAVLLCRMEQGEIRSYSDVMAIDRIRRANAQKHVPTSVTSSPQIPIFLRSLAKSQSPSLAHILIKVHVCRRNLMRPGGSFISIFVLPVSLQQGRHFHMLKLIAKTNIKVSQKMINIG